MITAYVLTAMWVSFVGGAATGKAIDHYQHSKLKKIELNDYAGHTKYVCEEKTEWFHPKPETNVFYAK
jgi:hypothetical protein